MIMMIMSDMPQGSILGPLLFVICLETGTHASASYILAI